MFVESNGSQETKVSIPDFAEGKEVTELKFRDKADFVAQVTELILLGFKSSI
jgi:hypothetical protein